MPAAGPPNFPRYVPKRPGAVKQRRRPTPAPPNFPRYVPKRPGAVKQWQPTRTQLRSARAQRRGYVSQGGAVRRAAKVQKTLGPGVATPKRKIVHQEDIYRVGRQPKRRAQTYVSQGKAVEKAAFQQRVKSKNVAFSTDPEVLKAAGFKKAGAAEALMQAPVRALVNAPKDVKELATTLPTSLYQLGKTTVTHPEKVPGLLADPYIEAVKHPIKAISEHPVSTALMFAPTVKVPLRAAGRVARTEIKAGGKTIKAPTQSLRHETATLEGTTMKVHRAGDRNVIPTGPRAIKRARRPKGERITNPEIHKRVDEFWDYGQQHKEAAVTEAIRDEVKKAKKEGKALRLPRAQRRALVKERVEERASGAAAGAHQFVERQFAHQHGSHWEVRHEAPKHATERIGERTITKRGRVPSREQFIAERPKSARGEPEPTVEKLTQNVKPGKPGISVEREYIRQVERGGKQVGWGREVPGGRVRVIVARNKQGKPIGALRIIQDAEGKADILEVAVDPAHRGKGLATALYTKGEREGFAVEAASGRGGYTEAGAGAAHKRLVARGGEFKLPVGQYKPTSAAGGVRVVKPPAHEDGGFIHKTREDAQHVADAIKAEGHFDPQVIKLEGQTAGVTSGYAVVPRTAAKRFQQHKNVGHGGFVGGPALRVLGRSFRQTTLPLSPKWLYGQATEAGIRAAAQGAGPISYLRGKAILRRLEKDNPEAAKALRKRTIGGGQFGGTGAVGHELIHDPRAAKALSQEFGDVGSDVVESGAKRLTAIGAKPGIRHIRSGYRRYTGLVFKEVNGRIEQAAKTAMLGKAAKTGPLMERRMIALGDKAMQEAADGLHGTAAQVELARAIDRSYGRYSKFSPAGRDYILHTTPYIPWFINMAHFLGHVMPHDHPIKTSLAASVNVALEDWRKKHRLSTRGTSQVPDFMLGSRPGKGADKFVPLARYGPFLPGDYASSFGGQITPQLQGFLQALGGSDWTGAPIRGPHGEKASQERLIANALLAGGSALVPGVGIADRVTGLGAHYVQGKSKQPSVIQGKSVLQGLKDIGNPQRQVGIKDTKGSGTGKSHKRKQGGFGGGGFGGGFGASGF